MALQYSVTLRNNQLDQLEATVGVSAKLSIRTGAAPANCAAADTGALVIQITLPSDWMNAAASGSKTKLGTWSGAATGAMSASGHFRIYDNAGTTCVAQGTVTATGGGGDMTVDNINIAIAQTVTVNTFTVNAANS